MAILNAQRAVNTRDLPELKNVENGTFVNDDPDGGAQSFGLPSFVGFRYRGPDSIFGNGDDPVVEVISTAGGTGNLAAAGTSVFQGTISSLFVKLGDVDLYSLSGFTPFDINELYADATNGLPTFPTLLFKGDDTLNGSEFDDILFAFAGADVVDGGGGDDLIDGGSENDTLGGGAGDDEVNGGAGDDGLTGGLGADIQTGGDGADTFFYSSRLESTKKKPGRDSILDLDRAEGDEIHLTAIDAKKGKGNQDFKWIGKKDFGDNKGELRYKVKNGDAWVEGDTDGNGKSDFVIVVADVTKLKAGDFDL